MKPGLKAYVQLCTLQAGQERMTAQAQGATNQKRGHTLSSTPDTYRCLRRNGDASTTDQPQTPHLHPAPVGQAWDAHHHQYSMGAEEKHGKLGEPGATVPLTQVSTLQGPHRR